MRRPYLMALLAGALTMACASTPPDGRAAAPTEIDPGAIDYAGLLSRDAVGAAAFTRAHPTWDGRGVVVAVLDTGVDGSVPGLQTTSDGKPKLIDARDFTGEGDVALSEARWIADEGAPYLRTDAGVVRGVAALEGVARGPLHVGFFDEASLKNSSVNDVDGDGQKNGRFAVVAWIGADDGRERVIIDTDGDGDVSDEVTRESFAADLRLFSFVNVDPRKNQTPVAFSVTTRLDERPPVVELHFDDGGHGTHVAGIAAGHGIQGRAGFDGVAPGAQVISLKIGHNALSGGATTAGSMKRAIEYASKWARDHGVPVVMNISYGIGSEIEGQSDIDKALDDALAGNPLLAASVSAGNEGPGLSSVGTPAAATLAWTAAAMLTPANAEALWGGKVKGNKVFSFSSRGGELAKPDGLTPGVAWSTVPPFLHRSVMAGTSMAAPQATGVHALVISAALAEGTPWTAGAVKRALRTTAKPLKGYTFVDQGAGLVQVGAAYEALKRQRGHKTMKVVAGWRVTTPIPSSPGNEGSASYWRVGDYLPDFPERIAFDVTPIFFADATDRDKLEAFDTFELDEDVAWLDADRGSFALRGDGTARIQVALRADALRGEPGLHVGTVRARVAGVEAFRMPVVVVVPHRFADVWEDSFDGKLEPGDIGRLFVEVPPGATTMIVGLSTPTGGYGDTYLMPYDPDGRGVQTYEHRASSETGSVGELVLSGPDLAPGVWELATYASYRNRATSRWTMDVTFRAVQVPDTLKYTVPEGGAPRGEMTLVNRGGEVFRGKARLAVDAIERRWTEKVTGTTKRIPFAIGADKRGVEIGLMMSKTDYNKFTDVAANILDGDGRAVAQEAFGQHRTSVSFDGPPGKYTLELVGGSTHEDPALTWEVEVELAQMLSAPITLATGGALTLYPNVPTPVSFEAARAFTETPDGYAYRAELVLEGRGEAVWYQAPITLER